MREDRLMREVVQSAKQQIRKKYPFHSYELEEKVMKQVQKQTRMPKWSIVAWPIGIAVSALLFFHVANPNNFVSGIVDKIGTVQAPEKFEWIEPDKGFSHALQNGYPTLPSVKKEVNGYTVEIKDVMVDQLRITYTMLVSGEKVEQLVKEALATGKDLKQYPHHIFYQDDYSLSSDIDVNIRGGSGRAELKLINGSHYLVFTGNYNLSENKNEWDTMDSMETILKQPNPVLDVKFFKKPFHDRVIDEEAVLAEIPLPLPKDVATARKNIQPATMNKPQLGDQEVLQGLAVKQVQLFPTVMRVQVQAQTKAGYTLRNLINPRLVDDQGKEYTSLEPTSLQNRNSGTATAEDYYLDMIPSLYFDAIPEKLALKFDGATISTMTTGSFRLELHGKFPIEAPFGNKSSQILNAYYENHKLHVVLPGEAMTEETQLKVDGVGYDSEITQNGTFIQTYPVPQKEVYQIDTQRADHQEIRMDGLVPILDGK